MNFRKSLAFTLAEMLIVIGIIGVVASLTIPSLTNSTNSKDTVAKVRKVQSNLEDAFGRMIAEYGETSEWSTFDTNTMGDRLVTSMKLTKNCKTQNSGNCFASNANYYTSSAEKKENIHTSTDVYKFIMASGYSVGVSIDKASCDQKAVKDDDTTAPADLKQICGIAVVDINNNGKGKHKHGTDMFEFYITRHGFYPVGFDGDDKFKYVDNCTKSASNTTVDSQACTAWVVNNGNMDYKKANSEGKCLSNTNKTLDFTTNVSCD